MLVVGTGTLLVLGMLTVILNAGVGGGTVAMAKTEAPLKDGLEAIFGQETLTDVLTIAALAGLLASFHNLMYAYGRVLFALSRAGYFPRWMSITGYRHTPYVALIVGAVIGLVCALVIYVTGGEKSQVGAALLSMAVFGAVLSYILVMVSFIKLRYSRPDLPRPYRSPLGVPGAAVGSLLAGLALLATLLEESYRPAVWGTAACLILAVAYFLLYSRHHLVAKAPEEELALLAEASAELRRQG